MRRIVRLAVVVVVLALGQVAQAAPILLRDRPIGLTSFGGMAPVDAVRLIVSIGAYSLFENLSFTPADAGTTIYTDSTTDDDFDDLVSLLTNDVDDPFTFSPRLLPSEFQPGSGTSPDARLFAPSLADATVSRIGLRINTLTFTPINSSVRVDLDADILIEGQGVFVAPEPAPFLLLGTGLGVVAYRRRRKP